MRSNLQVLMTLDDENDDIELSADSAGVKKRQKLGFPSAAESLFEMALDGVCIAGFDGYFKRVNPSWLRTLGWTEEELMARPIVDFVHPDDQATVRAKQQDLYTGGVLNHLVNRYRCKDGSYRWFQWKSVPHPDRKVVYAVARDITEQRESEEKMRQAEEMQRELQRQLVFADRMASVGTLAAGVAHEINNPLTFVTTNLTLILREIAEFDQSDAPLETIVELVEEAQVGAERIRKIVKGLRTFSRPQDEVRQVIDVLPILEMSIKMTSNEIRHRATLVEDFGEMPTVEADESRLGQVFINLLVNAAQALPERDSAANVIRVRTGTDEQGRALIDIEDTGSGIPQDLIQRIFDPFFTTKSVGEGTGLGLSICHTIITSMDGELTLTSEDGQGTRARITLPAASTAPISVASPTVTETNAAPEPKRAAQASVLVIDDEPAIGRVLRRILFKYDVTALTCAQEALSLLDAGTHYDVIFSDLMMPEMSGMEFFDELTRRHPEKRDSVVFISGGAFTPRAFEFLDKVPNQCLEKPFDAETILQIVKRYTDGGDPSS